MVFVGRLAGWLVGVVSSGRSRLDTSFARRRRSVSHPIGLLILIATIMPKNCVSARIYFLLAEWTELGSINNKVTKYAYYDASKWNYGIKAGHGIQL